MSPLTLKKHMSDQEQKALDDIKKYGCHILNVLEDDNHPGFSYSIGIQKSTGEPELVVYGLNHKLAQWIINEYNSRVRKGEKFLKNELYDGFLEGFNVTFIEVSKKHYKEHFGWGTWFYKDKDFQVLQLVYPSTSGIWPWEKDATEEFTWFQPILK